MTETGKKAVQVTRRQQILLGVLAVAACCLLLRRQPSASPASLSVAHGVKTIDGAPSAAKAKKHGGAPVAMDPKTAKALRVGRRGVGLSAVAGLQTLPLSAQGQEMRLAVEGETKLGGGCSATSVDAMVRDLAQEHATQVLLSVEPLAASWSGGRTSRAMTPSQLAGGFQASLELPTPAIPMLVGLYLCSDKQNLKHCRGKPWRVGAATAKAGDGIYFAKYFILSKHGLQWPSGSVQTARQLNAIGSTLVLDGADKSHVRTGLLQAKAMLTALPSPAANVDGAHLHLNLPGIEQACH